MVSEYENWGTKERAFSIMAYFHCRTRIQIRTRIPNPMATWYYAEHVSTDSDLDPDPFP